LAVIEAGNFTYTYPNSTKPAIDGISFAIDKGEFVILTGPSGCGKTTLCRCLNGLIPHFYHGALQGSIRVSGLDIENTQIHDLAKHVGLVFQNPENQLFALSVEKDVAFGLENLGVPRERMMKKVEWALKQAGIYDLRERAPHELSGGQQQRVAIAGILAMEPDIMVLDEPTSFLDPLGAKQIFEVIDELNKTLGVTVILVEHRLDLAARFATHTIIMDKGKIVLDGTPRSILDSEEARMLGVGIPKATRLYQTLKEEDVFHPEIIPVTADEIARELREALKT
jgi:energy-coupling factor transporter ATPase